MSSWLPLLYHFLIGGIIFLIGIVIPWKVKDHSWKRKEDRRTLLYMLGGFAAYLFLTVLWMLYGLGKI
ncbi:hypothetical protein ACFLT9_07260 [Acidobacteriota bacterium]